jgi:hypothetical protein
MNSKRRQQNVSSTGDGEKESGERGGRRTELPISQRPSLHAGALRPKSQREKEIYWLSHKWHTF